MVVWSFFGLALTPGLPSLGADSQVISFIFPFFQFCSGCPASVVVEGFGHSDLLIGEESYKKVFPHITSHIRSAERENGAISVGKGSKAKRPWIGKMILTNNMEVLALGFLLVLLFCCFSCQLHYACQCSMCFNEEKLFYIVLVDPYEEYGGFSTWFSPFVVILFVVSHVSCTMLHNVQCFLKRKSFLLSCQLNPYIKAIRILHNWPFLCISLKIGIG